jgi:hypothetical protein
MTQADFDETRDARNLFFLPRMNRSKYDLKYVISWRAPKMYKWQLMVWLPTITDYYLLLPSNKLFRKNWNINLLKILTSWCHSSIILGKHNIPGQERLWVCIQGKKSFCTFTPQHNHHLGDEKALIKQTPWLYLYRWTLLTHNRVILKALTMKTHQLEQDKLLLSAHILPKPVQNRF